MLVKSEMSGAQSCQLYQRRKAGYSFEKFSVILCMIFLRVFPPKAEPGPPLPRSGGRKRIPLFSGLGVFFGSSCRGGKSQRNTIFGGVFSRNVGEITEDLRFGGVKW
jgi:hypothetical protein